MWRAAAVQWQSHAARHPRRRLQVTAVRGHPRVALPTSTSDGAGRPQWTRNARPGRSGWSAKCSCQTRKPRFTRPGLPSRRRPAQCQKAAASAPHLGALQARRLAPHLRNAGLPCAHGPQRVQLQWPASRLLGSDHETDLGAEVAQADPYRVPILRLARSTLCPELGPKGGTQSSDLDDVLFLWLGM